MGRVKGNDWLYRKAVWSGFFHGRNLPWFLWFRKHLLTPFKTFGACYMTTNFAVVRKVTQTHVKQRPLFQNNIFQSR